MFKVFSILSLLLCFTSCVSKKEYNELVLEKTKAEQKTQKLEKKLESLMIYQQNLVDSINKMQ